MNSWTGIGVVVRDPFFDTIKNGKEQCKFCVAVDRNVLDENGKTQNDYINVTAIGRVADFCKEKVHKGSVVSITGRLRTWSYTPEDGIKRFCSAIQAIDMNLVTIPQKAVEMEKE